MTTTPVQPTLDVAALRADFPILTRTVHDGKPLVYLDSANTSQKPQQVIDTLSEHYQRHNANVARAVHALGEEATEAFEAARDKLAAFVKAPSRDEIVFTRGVTEGINLVANVLAWAEPPYRVGPGDEVVVTEMEHHSNIVPWQLLTQRTGATLRWFGVTDEGRLDLSNIDDLITERTKVVALAHVSNMLGTVNPIAEIARRAHEVGALVVVDAAQAVPQLPYDVRATGADLIGITGHKMLGPTGIGALWGRAEVLRALPPFHGGGEMIEDVRMERSSYAPPPHKFEAGTPPIAQAIGLGAAVDYLSGVGMDAVAAHEREITGYALERLQAIGGLRILGPTTTQDRGGAISFTIDGLHPHDITQVLDAYGIAVRGGHHCAKPLHRRFGIPASTRASAYLYTTHAEIDALADGIEQTKRFFGVA